MRIAWRQPLVGLLAFAQSFVPALQAARANPNGGQTVAGSATIQGQGTSNVIVNQSSSSAIINWNSFNIGSGEITRFLQPGASSYTLNRVTGSQSPSQILGTIEANGRIFLVNPDGFIFGTGAKINAGSFLATTHDISNANFMAGNFTFNIPGNPNAYILNQGTITANSGGFAALVAPAVRNEGVIVANLGTVALGGAGQGFVLDLYGDSLIKLYAGDTVSGTVLSSVLSNTGTLQANGGKVLLTAATAQKVVDSVINMSGVVEAQSVGTQNGMIVFGAQTASSKASGAPTQTVKISATIDASGKNPGETGGTVQITGEAITLQSAFIDASGANGGGKILVGGDYGGGATNAPAVTQYGQSLEATVIPTATTLSVDAASILNVSALMNGNGGKAVLWSNDGTTFLGTVKATGGLNGGNGGFVEISSPTSLVVNGTTDVSAPNGKPGTVLFDPNDVYIVYVLPSCVSTNTCGTNSYILPSSLSGGFSTVSGVNVEIDASVSSSGPLSFVATSNLYVNAPVYASGLGLSGVNIFLSAPVSSPNGTVSISETDLSVTPLLLSAITARNIALYGTSSLTLTAPVSVTGNLTLSAPALVVDQRLSAGAGIFLGGSNSVTINAPVTSNGLFNNATIGNVQQIFAPGLVITSPHVTVNNTATANNNDILVNSALIDGTGSFVTTGWLLLNNSGSLTLNLPVNTSGGVIAHASDITVNSYLVADGGLSVNLGGLIFGNVWVQHPAIVFDTPHLTVNATVLASNGDIVSDASVIDGAISLNAPGGWVSIGNASGVTLNAPVTASELSVSAPVVALNGNMTLNLADIAASTSLTGSGTLTVTGNGTFVPPFPNDPSLTAPLRPVNVLLSSPSINMTGGWNFTNVDVVIPGPAATVSASSITTNTPPALTLTNSQIWLGYDWLHGTGSPAALTVNGNIKSDNPSFVGCFPAASNLCAYGSNTNTITLALNGNISGGNFLGETIQLNSSSIANAYFWADGDISLLASSVTFGGGVIARAMGNFNISAQTLTFPTAGSQGFPTVALTGYDMNFYTSPTITGVGALTGYDAINPLSYIVIANSSNAPAGGAPFLMTADHINGQVSLAQNSSLTLDVTTLSQNVTTGPNSLLNITGTAITIDGAIALGSNSSLFVNSGVYLSKTSSATTGALTINGNIAAAANNSSSTTTIGLASAGDLVLNSTIDVSKLSPGTSSSSTPYLVFFVAGGTAVSGPIPYGELSGITGNIIAEPRANIVGGNGVLTFVAGQSVGSLNNPIPVTVTPFTGSNFSSEVSCALGLLACGTGGTLVTALGPSAQFLPLQGAYFSIDGTLGYLPSSSGGNIPPSSGTGGSNFITQNVFLTGLNGTRQFSDNSLYTFLSEVGSDAGQKFTNEQLIAKLIDDATKYALQLPKDVTPAKTLLVVIEPFVPIYNNFSGLISGNNTVMWGTLKEIGVGAGGLVLGGIVEGMCVGTVVCGAVQLVIIVGVAAANHTIQQDIAPGSE